MCIKCPANADPDLAQTTCVCPEHYKYKFPSVLDGSDHGECVCDEKSIMHNNVCQMCPSDSEKSGTTCLCNDENAKYDEELNMCICTDPGYFKQSINGGTSCRPCPENSQPASNLLSCICSNPQSHFDYENNIAVCKPCPKHSTWDAQ